MGSKLSIADFFLTCWTNFRPGILDKYFEIDSIRLFLDWKWPFRLQVSTVQDLQSDSYWKLRLDVFFVERPQVADDQKFPNSSFQIEKLLLVHPNNFHSDQIFHRLSFLKVFIYYTSTTPVLHLYNGNIPRYHFHSAAIIVHLRWIQQFVLHNILQSVLEPYWLRTVFKFMLTRWRSHDR